MTMLTQKLATWRNQFMESKVFETSVQGLLKASSRVTEGRSTHFGYASSALYRMLHPGISGNEFNGLGETNGTT